MTERAKPLLLSRQANLPAVAAPAKLREGKWPNARLKRQNDEMTQIEAHKLQYTRAHTQHKMGSQKYVMRCGAAQQKKKVKHSSQAQISGRRRKCFPR